MESKRRGPRASLFTDDGYVVGFDGSEMNGPDEMEQTLSTIFADHETGTYVAEVRAERIVSDDVAMLAAVAGLVPAGQSDCQPGTRSRRSSRSMRMAGADRAVPEHACSVPRTAERRRSAHERIARARFEPRSKSTVEVNGFANGCASALSTMCLDQR